MKYFSPLLIFILGWALLLASNSLALIGLTNGLLQLLLFVLVVCIPTWLTNRMSYVDIGWPWGLVLIGVVTLLLSEGDSEGDSVRVIVVSVAYIFAGARMGIGALKMWKAGMLKRELPRYEYQKHRWTTAGKTNVKLIMQVEVVLQGLANASFLAMPALVIATNPGEIGRASCRERV